MIYINKKEGIKKYPSFYIMSYFCECCKFYTIRRDNYERHLKTLKHIDNEKSKPKVSQNTSKSKPKVSLFEEYFCKYCNKSFKHKQSVSKHIKYSCKQNKDEDLKELVRLMNLQIQQKDKELEYQKQQNEKQQKQNETQQKQIENLMDKLQVNHITNNTYVQNNIQLLSYKDTDMSHLTNKDYERAIKKVNSCVKDMIEQIHFNPSKPENMNIYISNMKDKYIMVYEDGNWNIKQKNDELNSLYDMKEMLLEDWLETYGNDILRQKFRKYLNNKCNEEIMNEIKENIKMMLYNKKNLIS